MPADFIAAKRIEREVMTDFPKRIAELCALFLIALAFAGCSLVKWDDPNRMYGPTSIFSDHERRSGGAAE